MKFKRLLHSFPIFLGLLVAPFTANGADLNEILKKGEVVIAVPEASLRLVQWAKRANTRAMMLMWQN